VRQADELDMLSLFMATIDGMRMIPDVSALSIFSRVLV